MFALPNRWRLLAGGSATCALAVMLVAAVPHAHFRPPPRPPMMRPPMMQAPVMPPGSHVNHHNFEHRGSHGVPIPGPAAGRAGMASPAVSAPGSHVNHNDFEHRGSQGVPIPGTAQSRPQSVMSTPAAKDPPAPSATTTSSAKGQTLFGPASFSSSTTVTGNSLNSSFNSSTPFGSLNFHLNSMLTGSLSSALTATRSVSLSETVNGHTASFSATNSATLTAAQIAAAILAGQTRQSQVASLRRAEAHRRRTGEWPRYDSGPIPEAPGETWSDRVRP